MTVEFEIAYILGRDIRPDDAEFSVTDAVREVRAAFELVLSRFVDRRAVGWPSFAADNAAFQALILGEAIEPARLDELVGTLVVTIDGKEMARGLSGEDATEPAGALADLVATARERGMTLPKGSVVSTGTLSKPFDIATPHRRDRRPVAGHGTRIPDTGGPGQRPPELTDKVHERPNPRLGWRASRPGNCGHCDADELTTCPPVPPPTQPRACRSATRRIRPGSWVRVAVAPIIGHGGAETRWGCSVLESAPIPISERTRA